MGFDAGKCGERDGERETKEGEASRDKKGGKKQREGSPEEAIAGERKRER